MVRRSNQDLEKYYFSMFRNDYPLPDGMITYGDKPDVILSGKRKIGIELTNFFLHNGRLPNSEQVQRSAREAVVSKAQQLYLREAGRRIELTFSFNKGCPIRDQATLAKDIAQLVRNANQHKTGELSKESFNRIPELSFVYLNAREYQDAQWRVSQCHSVPIMSIDTLREIVTSKEALSKHYERCDAYWLILFVDFIDPAQDQEIRINTVAKVNSSIFERVIVYKTCFRQVFEAA